MDRLAGKVVIVTGAAMGIGRAVVELFAAEGATVVAADIAPAPQHEDPSVVVTSLDVTDEDAWAALVAGTEGTHGPVDVLVNNAGIISYEPVDELGLAAWHRVIEVDQTGVMLGMRAVIPSMRRAGGGSIVNMSSAWGVVGGTGVHAYQAAKGAVRSMSRNAAVTYAGDRIRVNSVIPGWIRTPLTDSQPEHLNRAVIDATPLGGGGSPSDIAYGCLYLASDEAAFVTGSDLVIDGGLLAH